MISPRSLAPWVILLLLLLVSIIVWQQGQLSTVRQQVLSLQDTTRHSRDALGREIAQRRVFEGSISDLREALSSQRDSLSRALAKEIKRSTRLAVALEAERRGRVGGGTTVLSDPNTLLVDRGGDTPSVVYVYPIYTWRSRTQWADFDVVARRDSTILDYVLRDRYTIFVDERRKGLFGTRYAEITVRNENPDVRLPQVQAVQVAQKRGISWWIPGITFIAGWLFGNQ